MKKAIFSILPGKFSLLLALFTFITFQALQAQCPVDPAPQQPCPPVTDCRSENPEFPGCQPPNNLLNVLLVLDESSSIASFHAEPDVEAAVLDFANTLHSNFTTANRVKLRIIEFSDNANDAVPLTDVSAANFVSNISNYLTADGTASANYDPDNGNFTNFEAALNKAASIPDIDIIFFFTDGIPTEGNTSRTTLIAKANAIKCAGTYIFAIGVGSGANETRIQDLSHTDKLGPGSPNLISGADYSLESFSSFGDLLTELANSLIDKTPPTVQCPDPIKLSNKPGECGNTVTFTPNVNDNCPGVTASCTPASGEFFPVGVTTVTCKATDKVGLTATCTFTIRILDLEAPNIVCPPAKTISCEDSTDPSNTGNPVALDNCGISSVDHSDVRVDGSCVNDFTINRTWVAIDDHHNAKTCLQSIKVEDKKPPVINCPAAITVTCDTSVLKTGVATATDNCLPRPTLSHSDAHVSGDCEWLCEIDRTWVAKDACDNTSKCVQRITKDVTPLIEQALNGNPLVLGQAGATVTLTKDHADCVVKWFPYNEVLAPKALPFDDAVAGADCKLMSNPLDGAGHIDNPWLGITMKLSLLVRLNPSLGTRKLSTFPCDMHFIIRQGMKPNADVNELLRVTNLALGNVNVNWNVPAHAKLVYEYLKCIVGDKTVCDPN